MSLIFEGIDMPKEGEWLSVIIKPTKEVIADTIRYRDNALLKTEYSSATQIEQPHGRLIDEKEVKKAQFIINDQWGSYPVISLGNLNCVPTILEAEE